MRNYVAHELVWHGKELRLRSKRGRALMTVVPDESWPGMWRARYPNGSLTDMVNLTRAKDAAQVLALEILNRPNRAA